MADTKIEWTDATWNPVSGCTWASPGCDNCYAARMTRRLEALGQEKYAGLTTDKHFNGVVRTVEDDLTIPLRWRKPRRIFVNSMSDLFHKDVPFEFVDRVFAVAALSPRHTYQILTKRPERMAEYTTGLTAERVINAAADVGEDGDCFAANWIHGWSRPQEVKPDGNPLDGTVWRWSLPNVHLGTSVEDQDRANERIPHLRRCPAAVLFLSLEPLLDQLTLYLEGIHWAIVGGESGPGARPMHPEWVRDIQEQCEAAGVAFFFKQWGQWVPYEPDAQPPFWSGQDGDMIDGHALPDLTEHEPVGEWYAPELDGVIYRRVGKKRAGHLLDGREWQEFPEPAGATA